MSPAWEEVSACFPQHLTSAPNPWMDVRITVQSCLGWFRKWAIEQLISHKLIKRRLPEVTRLPQNHMNWRVEMKQSSSHGTLVNALSQFTNERGQKAFGRLSASLQRIMTQWDGQHRASEHTPSSVRDFFLGWCFNFQSVWINNVWLSGPLLALAVSCLNPTAHRAWGSGSETRVWGWSFLCLQNGTSQLLSSISELWTKLIYQVLWTNDNGQYF